MKAPVVLLVDDDESTLELVAHVLRDGGYRTLEAADGKEALEAANSYEGPIPLLLTDIAMPGMNGVQLAKRICSQRPETKVIYITAFGDLFKLSPHALIPKPFTPVQLLTKVRETIASGRRAA
jgi:two-component system cell cycle sensor histidine kinase/response regulator CckA